MRISLNWLKKYVDVPVTDEELIRLIGARLVEVEGVIDETHKYDNIFIVKVESCEKIPDTHLTLCQVDCGGKELVQVVCGAPNVREGMLAVWIAPGAVVPASVREDAPFVIGKRKMRGYESNGMLAGADELDFGDDHSGIVEIEPESAKPGELLADVFELADLVLEIENKSLTHRPDCFGIVGFAREIAGILGQAFVEPDDLDCSAVLKKQNGMKVDLEIKIEDSSICQRYSALMLEKHGEKGRKYLTWVDTVLSKSGMKPINVIVDATNYMMLLTGQPLHAFDYDKFVAVGGTQKPEIVVRLAQKGEKLVLLDDTEVELDEHDIVICSGEVPVALAGAMGGRSTMIDENTRKIILESATFSLYNLRKTQMLYGIFSEAITRFTKGQPPYQTLTVAGACAQMLAKGFAMVGEIDEYPKSAEKIVVKITTDEINGLLGTGYADDLIRKTLENVGFVVKGRKGKLEILVPEWRTDIHIKEDMIEEVGRLLGYDNIKPVLPLHRTAIRNEMWELKHLLRELLAKYGANEVLTYSFVSGKLLERVGQDLQHSYKIVNSISPELQYVRQAIVPSLLEKAYVNQKLPVDRFAIFEMNKVYNKTWGESKEKVPAEKTMLGCVIAERKNVDTAYYKAKMYVAKICEELNIKIEFSPGAGQLDVARPFETKRAAQVMVGDVCIGIVGEFKNSVRNEFKLAPYLAGFELDMDLMLEHASRKRQIELTKVEKRDLTVTTKETYSELTQRIEKVLHETGTEAKISPMGVYQPLNGDEKNISVHLDFTKFNEKAMKKLENL